MTKIKTVHINLRLPADLHRALVGAVAAKEQPVSLNTAICGMIRRSIFGGVSEQVEAIRSQWQDLTPREREMLLATMASLFRQAVEAETEKKKLA
jgi:HicB family